MMTETENLATASDRDPLTDLARSKRFVRPAYASVYEFAVLLAHACLMILAACVFPEPDRNNALPLGCTLGAQTGYFVLLGYWFALYPSRLLSRALVCITLLVAITFIFGCYVIRTGGPESVIVVMFCAGVAQWFLALIPGWLMRFAGWTYRSQNTEDVESGQKQFHVRHLLAWTTAIAILFGVGRVTAQPLLNWLESLDNQGFSFGGFFAILVIGHAVMGGPIIWAHMSRKAWLAWAVIAVGALVAGSYLEFLFLRNTVVSKMMVQGVGSFVAAVTVTFALTLVSLLLIVRFRGWALVHSSERA